MLDSYPFLSRGLASGANATKSSVLRPDVVSNVCGIFAFDAVRDFRIIILGENVLEAHV